MRRLGWPGAGFGCANRRWLPNTPKLCKRTYKRAYTASLRDQLCQVSWEAIRGQKARHARMASHGVRYGILKAAQGCCRLENRSFSNQLPVLAKHLKQTCRVPERMQRPAGESGSPAPELGRASSHWQASTIFIKLILVWQSIKSNKKPPALLQRS